MRIARGLLTALAATTALAVSGCTRPFIPIPVTLGGDTGLVFAVEAGEPSQRNLPVTLSLTSDLTIGSAELRFDSDNISFSPAGAGKGTVNAQGASTIVEVTVRVGGPEDLETVCAIGEAYGPFEVVLDAEFNVVSIEPPTVTLSEETVALFNDGAFTICLEVVSSESGTVTINGYTIVVGG